MPTLYIVATPIGNLEDITLRALRILQEVDVVLCEDTRVTKKLLDHYDIAAKLTSYHQHSDTTKIEEAIRLLSDGKNLALVTDAGTPGISDPGGLLIKGILENDIEAKIVPIPGAAAVTAAASISGFPVDKFIFMGFPPVKNKRKKYFEEIIKAAYPVIFYESSHRIQRTLKELSDVNPNLQTVVARELTKQFEEVYRGTIDEVKDAIHPKGEFIVVINAS